MEEAPMKRAVVIALTFGLVAGACGGDSEPKIDVGDGGDYELAVTAADFVAGIDNAWLGASWAETRRSS
jgi:hypothetical protein